MKVLIVLYSIIFLRTTTFAQNPEGEYKGISNSEYPFIENVNLVLKCDKTFLLSDSAIQLSGGWFVNYKSTLILSCISCDSITSNKKGKELFQLRFDVNSTNLIWSLYSIQDYRKLKFNELSSSKKDFNKRKWRDYKLIKSTSYSPCP